MSRPVGSNLPLMGKTALVIGGSRGIGRAIVERFAADDASVAFSYVERRHAAEELADAIAHRGGCRILLCARSMSNGVRCYRSQPSRRCGRTGLPQS
jgi:NAD(P)-dependent dehydrogenase (short-subunit alcohol dehydrogenase family)